MNKETLDRLLIFGVQHGASDIHLEVGSPPWYRVKGDLLRAKYEPLSQAATMAAAQVLLGERGIELARLFPEQDTSYSIAGVSRFRVSVFRQRGSVGCVLRIIPYTIRSIDELNLPPVLKELAKIRRGLILVTGATGMGKSSTIAAILQLINDTRSCHVITIEDPIEFLHPSRKALVIQREVGMDTHSYADGLVAALRQDPDVIMLGEIRDAGTASSCLKAAETGHAIIATLHTPDVATSIKRWLGLFDPREVEVHTGRLADCLQAIISLRLLLRADGTGLVPAAEIMRVTHSLQAIIRDPARHGEIHEYLIQGREMYGMQTFDQHLLDLTKAGIITLESAKLAATRPAELERDVMLG
jgi:twitching motility protein PilT